MRGNKGSILVVDDNLQNQQLCQDNLGELEGYDILFAGNGEECLHRLEEDEIDLILLDIMMPKMDGWEALGAIKKNPMTKTIPVIMLTAKTTATDKIKFLEAGAQDYLCKPFDVNELVARVNIAMNLRKAENKLRGFKNRITEELELASAIQKGLILPTLKAIESAEKEGLQIAVFSQAASEITGDMYCIRHEDTVSILLADCVGHGISAAMYTMLLQGIIPNYPMKHIYNSKDLVSHIDHQLRKSLPKTVMVPLIHALYDVKTSMMRFTKAGMLNPLIWQGTSLDELTMFGKPLRIGVEAPHLEEKEITLQAGDKVFLYSDGLVETMNDQEETFGLLPTDKMFDIIKQNSHLPAQKLLDVIIDAWKAFPGTNTQSDDCTFILIEKH